MDDQDRFDKSKTDVDSMTRRGEDVSKDEQEAGRHDTGSQGPTDRPTGTSTTRDVTGVNPQDVTSDQDRSPAG